HPAQHTGDEHGGRGAAAFGREGREAGAVPRGAALRVAAAEAETKLAGDEPDAGARADVAIGGDVQRRGTRAAIVGLQPRVATRIVLDPVLGEVLVAIVEREVGVTKRMKGDETELLDPVASICGLLVVLRRRRCIVDATRKCLPRSVLIDEANGMVLVPALAAEVHRIEALLRLVREELLPVDRDCALTGGLERGEGVPRAGDELMQLEREEAARVRLLVVGAILL